MMPLVLLGRIHANQAFATVQCWGCDKGKGDQCLSQGLERLFADLGRSLFGDLGTSSLQI